MENKAALKLIDKIIIDLDNTGINTDVLISDITKLRSYALEEQIPLVVKVLRLASEHIAAHDSFLIPMPVEESEEEEEEVVAVVETENEPVESLKYLIALTRNLNNKINISDLKEYRDLLTNY